MFLLRSCFYFFNYDDCYFNFNRTNVFPNFLLFQGYFLAQTWSETADSV